MNHVVQDTQHFKPRVEVFTRGEAIRVRPDAGRSPSSTEALRHSLSRFVAVWWSRRRKQGQSGPNSRPSSGSRIIPFASGATHGVVLFVRR